MASVSCPGCGGENPEGMRFCGHCGSPLHAAPPATPAPAAAATAVAPPVVERPPPEVVLPPVEAPPSPTAPDPDRTDALRSFVTGQVADRLVEAGGRLTEERRLVTALFADLSGFTPLSERLDPEQLLEVIDPIISALTDVVGRYEGFVEKFAGDALLALFGAPVSHEDDAARALLVASEMHRELARLRVKLGEEARDLTLHVGVNSGHGIARMIGSQVRMDYGVLGDSVILAQRLESAAPPGETYVGETTHRLTRDRFEFESVGPLTLKGKAEPVPAWRLIGEAPERASIGTRRAAAPLVGREEEVRALTAVLDVLAAGTGGAVSVEGEPGVGKSRLTETVREEAAARGIRWLEARCLSYGVGLPYWPYAELLRRVAGIRVEDPAEEARARLSASLGAAAEAYPFFARLLGLPLGEDGARLAGLEPEAFRRGLHGAFTTWLRSLSQERPIVLAVEDGHWADPSSIALTLDLAHGARDEPVLLYLTARPTGAGLVHEMRGSESGYVRLALELKPLDEEAVTALAEHMLGGGVPRGLLPVLLDRGAGNPFFVQETVRALQETGALLAEDGRWRLKPGWDAADVPPTIEGVLSARIDSLPSRASSTLQVASVIGRRVPVPLLRAVGRDLPELDPAVEQLVASGLLDEAGDRLEETVVFHHALVQDVAYARLLRRRKRELHRRVAEEAEAMYGSGEDSIDLLARHLYLGDAGAKAVDYLVRAGERARRLFANDEAIVHFSRAAELVRADASLADRLPEILLTLGDLHEMRGDYEQSLALFAEVGEVTGDVRGWRGVASTLRHRGEYARALSHLDAAFAAPALDAADLRPLWLERAWSLYMSGRMPEAIAALRSGLESGETTADVAAARLRLLLSTVESAAGRYTAALQEAEHARRIFEEHADLPGLAAALRAIGGIQLRLGDLDEAAVALRKALALAERVGSADETGGSLINLALVERDRGFLDEAIAYDRRAIEEFERIRHGAGRAIGYANLAEKLVRAGQLEEAERANERARQVAVAIGHAGIVAQTVQTLAEIRLAQERYEESARLAEEGYGLYQDADEIPPALECLELATRAWELAGDQKRARELAEQARSLASRVG